ncbi:taste receptor type 1 member 1-like protein [Labeo rohita]|uniref:Taste receptor type 1 member 1-like protein n=1 Tax=Labeo rohita TaxID=84645 RepID=A0A498P483_LABRO|nr:taste receptor type 1 member 1-like protein [Labeo rohita]
MTLEERRHCPELQTRQVWIVFFTPLGMTISLSSGYHPQSNGHMERKIQEIDHFQRTFCHAHQNSWTGPYGSTRTITIAPLITMDLIPMVNYGAASYALSNKLHYPSFVRTIPSNKDLIEMIIHIIQWFGWNWVAFLGSEDDYSSDGLKLFNKYINNTGICLAYQERLSLNANYSLALKKIDKLNINVIVVFALTQYASKIIKAAIASNIQDKVWIASPAWSMNQQIPREPGIEKIGTIIGIAERLLSLPGFDEFIYKARGALDAGHNDRAESDIQSKSETCNQCCDYCSLLTTEDIINESPTHSFAIYAAIYTIAHALHKVLQCDMNGCPKNTMAKPYMVKFDDNYDPTISYAVVLWHTDVNPPQFEMVGTYDTNPEITLTINNSLMPWRNKSGTPITVFHVQRVNGLMRAAQHNGSVKPKEKLNNYQPKVIALTGPYGSTRTMTIAPLTPMDLIPMVNYGAASYALSNKLKYPSVLLEEIKKLDFLLNGRQVKYDENYDPSICYAVVLWHTDVNPPQFEIVGTYDTHPEITLTINNSLMAWHNNSDYPFKVLQSIL